MPQEQEWVKHHKAAVPKRVALLLEDPSFNTPPLLPILSIPLQQTILLQKEWMGNINLTCSSLSLPSPTLSTKQSQFPLLTAPDRDWLLLLCAWAKHRTVHGYQGKIHYGTEEFGLLTSPGQLTTSDFHHTLEYPPGNTKGTTRHPHIQGQEELLSFPPGTSMEVFYIKMPPGSFSFNSPCPLVPNN